NAGFIINASIICPRKAWMVFKRNWLIEKPSHTNCCQFWVMTAFFKNSHHNPRQTILVLMCGRTPVEKLAASTVGML
ncbi:hypothetical protein, partial [Brucella intermedia]|uniref:hypothetical protein n=1 Tax=Brucella intermedia TaxID=94625 RepID=UPI002249930E